jgi:L-arabonate dehydrase
MPTLVDLMPSGRFLMEDFCYAGGLPTVMRALGDLLELDALTVTGSTLSEREHRAGGEFQPEVIRPADKPLVAPRRHRRAARQPRAAAPSSSRRPPRRS